MQRYRGDMKMVRYLLAASLGACASAASAAEGDPVASVEGWSIYDEKGTCAAATLYERDVFVRVEYDFGRDSVWLSIANPAWESVQDAAKYTVQLSFTNGEDWGDTAATGFRLESDSVRMTGIRLHLDGDDFLTDFALAAGMLLRMGDTRLGSYSLAGTKTMVRRLNECAVASYKRYPPDPFAGAGPTGGAAGGVEPKANLASLFSNEDYPASAQRAGEQGKVGFTLTIGTDGRVTGCRVTSSSGSSSLDSTTCRLLQRRARFTPARDARGNPVAADHSGSINWRLPVPPSPAPGRMTSCF